MEEINGSNFLHDNLKDVHTPFLLAHLSYIIDICQYYNFHHDHQVRVIVF